MKNFNSGIQYLNVTKIHHKIGNTEVISDFAKYDGEVYKRDDGLEIEIKPAPDLIEKSIADKLASALNEYCIYAPSIDEDGCLACKVLKETGYR